MLGRRGRILTQHRLRPAREADRPFLARLHEATRAELITEIFGSYDWWLVGNGVEPVFDPCVGQIVEVEDEAAGFLCVHWNEEGVRIHGFHLLPDRQGQGLGSALLTDIIDRADREYREPYIHDIARNPARDFFVRRGFEIGRDEPTWYAAIREPRPSPPAETGRCMDEGRRLEIARTLAAWIVEAKPLPGRAGERPGPGFSNLERYFLTCDFVPGGKVLSDDPRAERVPVAASEQVYLEHGYGPDPRPWYARLLRRPRLMIAVGTYGYADFRLEAETDEVFVVEVAFRFGGRAGRGYRVWFRQREGELRAYVQVGWFA